MRLTNVNIDKTVVNRYYLDAKVDRYTSFQNSTT